MSSETIGLLRWPSKGNRRHLEAQWLEQLEGCGVTVALPAGAADATPELGKAIGEFNSGLFWECHESLEEVWRGTPYPQRFFYHAVIKAAVGFHHLRRHNRHGTRAKLSDSVRLLKLLPHWNPQESFQGSMGYGTDRPIYCLSCQTAQTLGCWSYLELLPPLAAPAR